MSITTCPTPLLACTAEQHDLQNSFSHSRHLQTTDHFEHWEHNNDCELMSCIYVSDEMNS
jgi:hypothetical protein